MMSRNASDDESSYSDGERHYFDHNFLNRHSEGDSEHGESFPSSPSSPPSSWQIALDDSEERARYLRETGALSDVTISINQASQEEPDMKLFKCHRVFLGSCSPIFCKLFLTHDNDISNGQPLQITDIEPNIFELTLDYCYLDEFNLDTCSDAMKLYTIADNYGMIHLASLCLTFLEENTTIGTALDVLDFAVGIKNKGIQRVALVHITTSTEKLLQTTSFFSLSPEALIVILNQPTLAADEIAVFNGILKWARCRVEHLAALDDPINVRKILDKSGILQMIHFEWIKADDFCTYIKPSDIFSANENCELLMFVTGNITNKPDFINSVEPLTRVKSDLTCYKCVCDGTSAIKESELVTLSKCRHAFHKLCISLLEYNEGNCVKCKQSASTT